MAVFKCKMCGGDLNVADEQYIAECEYCGTSQTVPGSRDENLRTLYNRANNLRVACEFDKAAEIYETIVNSDEEQSEAYFGLVLCKYGIEYVEDPRTYKRIPTCHRCSYEVASLDPNFKAAIKHAHISQRALYEAEAKKIDELQAALDEASAELFNPTPTTDFAEVNRKVRTLQFEIDRYTLEWEEAAEELEKLTG